MVCDGICCLQTVSSYATVRIYMLDVGDNSTVNSTQLGIILDSVANDEFVIMAVQPLQAYDIWSAARSLVYLHPVASCYYFQMHPSVSTLLRD